MNHSYPLLSNPTSAAGAATAKTPTLPGRILVWSDVMSFSVMVAAAIAFSPRNAILTAGLALAAAGFVLWMIARRQLGNSFAVRAEARELVDTGLYRRFRHPIYYFGTIAMLGALIAIQVWPLLACWLAFNFMVQSKRMRREDAALEAAFGEPFRQLRRGSWM